MDQESKEPEDFGMKRSKRFMNFDALPGNFSGSGRDPTDGTSSIMSDPFLFGRNRTGQLDPIRIGEAYFGL